MSRKFETEKHFKKRHQHFIGQDHLKPSEKMAALKENVSTVEGKTEALNMKTEPLTKSTELTPPAPSPSPPSTPMAEQKIFQFTKKKNWLDKLKDKFHRLIDHK